MTFRPKLSALAALAGICAWGGAFAQEDTAAASAAPATQQAPAPQAAATAAQPVAPAAQQVDANSYLIGPGDTLQVFVWREPSLSTTVPVRPDGKITTPLVEDMVAVGKTPSQLAREMEKVLAKY